MRTLPKACLGGLMAAALGLSNPPMALSQNTIDWQASSGFYPDAFCPLTITDTATPEDPALGAGVLTMSTSGSAELMYYTQSNAALAIPPTLTMEARLRVASEFHDPGPRRGTVIGFKTSSSRGNVLCFGVDEVFLWSAFGVQGTASNVDTDGGFHDYRIEVEASGSGQVRVYQDNIQILTGSLITDAGFGSGTDIYFGDGTGSGGGVSEWQSFSHNASTSACLPCNCAGHLEDHFEDGAIGAPTWTLIPGCGTPTEVGGELVMSKQAACVGTMVANLLPTLCGDFDVQVDFNLPNFNVPPSNSRWLTMYVSDRDGLTVAGIERYNRQLGDCNPGTMNYKSFGASTLNCNSSWAATSDMSGKFRILRAASTVTTFFWGGSAWVPLRVITGVTKNPLRFGLYSGGDLSSAQEGRFDNLVITSGGCANEVVPQVPATCIAGSSPCVAVPISWNRLDTTPARGYSVEVEISANLSLCGVQFASGGYLLPGSGGAHFAVTSSGPNRWIVDEATLGLPCGNTGPGTLFTVYVTSSAPSGTGSVSVLSTIARDCDNAPIAAAPGPAASIVIDNEMPAAVTLSAVQKKIGNSIAPVGTTDVLVNWTGQENGSSVAVYRKGFGGYPQYDENGGAVPSAPATPAAAVLAGWALSSVTTSGGADRVAGRDFHYYVAFVTDGCGNVSTVSNVSNGTLNYLLGDVHDGTTNCAGNNTVNTSDISFLGANYGLTLAINDALECLDVGPTTDFSIDARPTTDNKTGFEDLIVLAINHGSVAAPKSLSLPTAAPENALKLGIPALQAIGQVVAVSMDFAGVGNIQGFTAELDYDSEVVEFLGVEPGDLVGRQAGPGVVLSAHRGNVDVALLGTGYGLVGHGPIARVLFRVRQAGDAAIVLKSVDARDAANRPLALEGDVPPVTTVAPTTTALAPARPTPFRDATVLEYALASGGIVELAIYSVDGRLVAVLERGDKAAGVYRIAWDGHDERGGRTAAGMYYARLVTPQGEFSRTLIRVR